MFKIYSKILDIVKTMSKIKEITLLFQNKQVISSITTTTLDRPRQGRNDLHREHKIEKTNRSRKMYLCYVVLYI